MPFISNRIEAICGAHVIFMSTDPAAKVKTELGGKGAMCAGCTFTINHLTGRTTLIDTDKYRNCLEEKAPIADKTPALE